MERKPLTRDDYAKLPLHQLRSRLASVQDRITRADTMEDALFDHFAEQELQAAISAKAATWIAGATPEDVG